MIQILYSQGYSKKHIARELGISINTVRKYIASDGTPEYSIRGAKPMKLEPYQAYIDARIRGATPHWVPATVIFEEIKGFGYLGGITRLREYLRLQKPAARLQESLQRFETEPGKQMQVDWAIFRKGCNRLVAFIATLGYSRTSYVEFVTDEKLATLLRCHENAFEYFGGVPLEGLYDNMKTVIVERDCYGEGKHRLQSGFWDFSKHYNFIPRVCRPYRAQTKGKVERFIHYLRYSFYYPLLGQLKNSGLVLDVGTANQKVWSWLNQTANKRMHGTTGKAPFELLQDERPYLQKIAQPYSGRVVDIAVTTKNTHHNNRVSDNFETLQHDLSVYEALTQSGGV